MEKLAVLSFIAGLFCLLMAIPGIAVGLFVGPHILISALCYAVAGIALVFFARRASRPEHR
jgi:hypothetical protein